MPFVASASGPNGALPVPPGVSSGDVLLASFILNGNASVSSAPAGWTLLLSTSSGSGVANRKLVTYVRQAGSEPASYTWSLSAGTAEGVMTAWRGVYLPVEASGGASQVNSSGTVPSPSITTTSPSALLVMIGAVATSSALGFTPPAGMTERVDTTGSAVAERYVVADETQASPGATGTRNATVNLDGSTNDTVGHLLAFTTNLPPNAPTLVSPVTGSIDLAAVQRFSWTFSDPDAGDSQSKFDLRYRAIVATNEVQTVTITGTPTGGTFTLTYSGQTTAAIAYNANAAAVQSALEALSNIAVGDVAVSGGALPGTAVTVTFQGALATTNVAQMTATSSLTGGTTPTVTVATTQQGVPVPSWTDITGVTPNNFYDLAASTLTAGDYEWQVRTYDALGAVGPYSSSGFFTAATVSNDITITAPTNGATISTETFTVTWSTPTQTHYQLRVVADLAGAPDTATVIYDTGEIASSSARSRSVSYPDNGVTRHTQVRKKQDGLWSDWASVSNPVSYTAPAVPGITVDDTSQPGAIQVQATHPTPTGSEPTVSYMDVWRRRAKVDANGNFVEWYDTERDPGGENGFAHRNGSQLAPTAIFTDWFVNGSGYSYRVRDVGSNGTSSYSEWSDDGSGEVVDEIDGGAPDTVYDDELDGGGP